MGFIPGFEYVSSGSALWLLELSTGLAFNIRTQSTAYPYLEGRIGYNTTITGTIRSGIIWLIGGGVKVKVGGNALLVFGLFYEQSTLEKSPNEGGRNGTNSWGADAGFSIFFGN